MTRQMTFLQRALGVGLGAALATSLATGISQAQTPKDDNKAVTPRKGVFNPEVATLPNGLRIIVITNRRAPIVYHMLWIKAGSADEEAGKSGIAHFLEHMMFRRSKMLKSGEYDRIVSRNGGAHNAFTSYDYTAYFEVVHKDRLELMMKINADRMVNLEIDPKEFETERKVVIEERESRTETRPSALLREAANATMYRNHRYGVPIIGWMHEIRALSRDDAFAFYKRHYRPNNAILIVAGDVTMKEVLPLAKKYYGPLERGPEIKRIRAQEPPSRTARRVVLRDRRVASPIWGRSYMAPSYNAGAKQHAYALQILTWILGGSSTSRLYESLVVKQKLATRAWSNYSSFALDLETFTLGATPRPGVPVARVEAAVNREIARVLTEGVTADEVARAKRSLRDAAIFARDSMRTGAYVFGYALTTGTSVADVEAWPKRIAAVTAAQVNAAARHVFQAKKSVTTLLLPAAPPPAPTKKAN